MELLKDNQGIIWTSPEGVSFYIKTTEFEYSIKHIGEVKENPKPKNSNKKKIQDSNDTFTDSGIGGRDISLDCYFIGDDHTQKSAEFKSALCEIGKSKLKLPDEDEITVNVLKFSSKRSLVKNKNCTIVTVDFHQTSKTAYPVSSTSQTKQIINTAEDEKNNIAENLSSTVSAITKTSDLQDFTTNFSTVLSIISDKLSLMNNSSLKSIMTDILSQSPVSNIYTITSQIGLVFYKAACLANNIKNTISDTISGNIFGNLNDLISGLISHSKTSSETLSAKEINNLVICDSTASSAIISLAESLLQKNYETRSEAVKTAKTLKEIQEEWTDFIDDELSKITDLSNVFIQNENLNSIINAAANEILELSYKLKVEQTIILSEDTTAVDIAYTYYHDEFKENPEETLDYLITTNNLTDDEFFLLPKNKEVKIYV